MLPYNNKEELLDTIAAMRQQEQTSYPSVDFLGQNPFADVDRSCRSKMAQWCNQVVEFCKFSRESVEVAMSLVDRYVTADPSALKDRNTYQLAAMTCLYLAIKVHEHMAIHSNVITQLSQGTYSIQQVEAMEQRILKAIDWRVNPPTSASFARCMVSVLPANTLTEQERSTVLHLTQLQCEAAIVDYRFIAVPASTLAFSALVNALESLGTVAPCAIQHVALSLAPHLLDAHHCPHKLSQVRTCLLETLEHSVVPLASSRCTAPAVNSNTTKTLVHHCGSNSASPRSVAARR